VADAQGVNLRRYILQKNKKKEEVSEMGGVLGNKIRMMQEGRSRSGKIGCLNPVEEK
jgi:hypothetical protein